VIGNSVLYLASHYFLRAEPETPIAFYYGSMSVMCALLRWWGGYHGGREAAANHEAKRFPEKANDIIMWEKKTHPFA
jgi:hypothetical protein